MPRAVCGTPVLRMKKAKQDEMAFKKAKAEQAALKIGIYGRQGSGKTFTALMMAEGIAATTKKRVAYVDTERGTDFYTKAVTERRIHPEAFDFDAIYTRSIAEVTKEVRALKPAEYCCVVLDSVTHLWEAAVNAYSGRKGGGGQIPFHAWTGIKKPYKELMQFLINSPMHVLLCGREGQVYETDPNTDEVKASGFKMKAEGETPYEPHILFRMDPERNRDGSTTIRIYAEKDRTSVLAGQTIVLYTPDGKTPKNATFDRLVKPLLGLLGDKQAQVETNDEAAARDSEEIAAAAAAKDKRSLELREEYEARFKLAKTSEDVEALSKELTKDLKAQMHAEDVTALRDAYKAAAAKAKGETTVVRDPEANADPRDAEAP